MLIGKVCKYKLLRTECNASSLEMNSKYKKKQQRHEPQAVAVLNSQIKSQNPRIRSNTTRIRKNRKPGGEDRPGKPGETTTPGERTARYHSAAVVPDTCPNFSFLGTKKFVHNTFIFVENP